MIKKTLALAAAALVSVFTSAFAETADQLTLTRTAWYDAGVANLTPGATLGDTSGWTTNDTGSVAITGEVASACVALSDCAVTYTPTAASSATIVEQTSRLHVDALAVDPDDFADMEVSYAEQAQFTVCSDGSAFSFRAKVLVGGATNVVTLVGKTPVADTDYDIVAQFDYRVNPNLVSFLVKTAAESEYTRLADSDGNIWFTTLRSDTKLTSVTYTGTGTLKSSSGANDTYSYAASYNSTNYDTFAEAIAAGVADSFAAGAVTLLADASWTPSAAGTYQIDAGSYTLTIGGDYYTTIDDTTYTILNSYYWIGGASGTFTTASNWSRTSGGDPADAYPSTANDAAIFDSAAAVSLSAKTIVGRLVLNDTVSFTSTTAISVSTSSVDGNHLEVSAVVGTGKLVMSGVSLRSGVSGAPIETPVEIAANTTNLIRVPQNCGPVVSGNLSGSGYLYTWQESNYTGVTYDGDDNSAFTGTINARVKNDVARDRTTFTKPGAAISNGRLIVNYYYTDGNDNALVRSNEEYIFGGIEGRVWLGHKVKGATVTIGNDNSDSSISGAIARVLKDNSNPLASHSGICFSFC